MTLDDEEGVIDIEDADGMVLIKAALGHRAGNLPHLLIVEVLRGSRRYQIPWVEPDTRSTFKRIALEDAVNHRSRRGKGRVNHTIVVAQIIDIHIIVFLEAFDLALSPLPDINDCVIEQSVALIVPVCPQDAVGGLVLENVQKYLSCIRDKTPGHSRFDDQLAGRQLFEIAVDLLVNGRIGLGPSIELERRNPARGRKLALNAPRGAHLDFGVARKLARDRCLAAADVACNGDPHSYHQAEQTA